jgi:hypothetical protein
MKKLVNAQILKCLPPQGQLSFVRDHEHLMVSLAHHENGEYLVCDEVLDWNLVSKLSEDEFDWAIAASIERMVLKRDAELVGRAEIEKSKVVQFPSKLQ